MRSWRFEVGWAHRLAAPQVEEETRIPDEDVLPRKRGWRKRGRLVGGIQARKDLQTLDRLKVQTFRTFSMLPHVDETILPHQTSAAQLLKSPSWWHLMFRRCAGDPADHSPAHMLWKREHDSLPTAHTLPAPNNLRGNLNAFFIYLYHLFKWLLNSYLLSSFFLVYMFR